VTAPNPPPSRAVVTVSPDVFEQDRIEAIASSLDLRAPNKEALESIAYEVVQHFEMDNKQPPFEGVVDAATGVGKTYIIASAIDYFAGRGTRNFAVIAPNRTILNKTVANFTAGDAKSLLGGMSVEPSVITAENFATPAVRAIMDDEDEVKLYVFTVQALTNPRTDASRKTRKFQEGLGQAFYERLQEAGDLVVLADEHHAYFGPAFSKAVSELDARVLIGLTATPHKKTKEEQVIYRYPLAAAIADQLVKTPVLVGRRDDLSDPQTKLLDGITLLELKEQVIKSYCRETGAQPVNPVMLVVAPSIEEADEISTIVKDQSFAGGRYADRALTVHSDAPDEALEALDKLEEPDSPVRIVVSVGMLNVGWDVKSVYVICSLRASVSDLLTEQTLGRGLRLPFGAYTGIEILDSLEVLGHERYEDLLKKAGVLNEKFVDRRTRAVLRRNAQGQMVPQLTTTTVSAPVVVAPEAPDPEQPGLTQVSAPTGQPMVSSVEDHIAQANETLTALKVELPPRPDLPTLKVPRLRMTPVQSEFSLADITDLQPFRQLGERIAADPEGELRRTTLSARIIQGADGLRRTELVTAPAVDKVSSPAAPLPLGDARDQLTVALLSSTVVPARANQHAAAQPLIDAFLDGLADKAESVLAGFMDRAAAGLISLVGEQQRRFASKPSYKEVVESVEFSKTRTGKPEPSQDRAGTFKRAQPYEGYTKSLYAQDWFDSAPERAVANIMDEAEEVQFWVRLQRGDLPILWSKGGREYNPDFIAVENGGARLIVEVKSDKDMDSADVQGKREAAKRWANHVNADTSVLDKWAYLLVSETDIKTAHGSWPALKQLAS
jgi:type III restriction enzyme